MVIIKALNETKPNIKGNEKQNKRKKIASFKFDQVIKTFRVIKKNWQKAKVKLKVNGKTMYIISNMH